MRRGPSDAFALRLARATLALTGGVIYGGSGADRATAIDGVNGGVALAGVTTSQDLAMLSPLQAAYGGGASDAFAAWFSGDLTQLTRSTYLGGSGVEEVSSGSSNLDGAFAFGGWTTSNNFPVQNAVQPSYGGGASDGFAAHFDPTGNPMQITYFGGSGTDRILSTTLEERPTLTVSGETTSLNLPVIPTGQNGLAGITDGFVATVSMAGFAAPSHFLGGVGVRTEASVHFNSANGAIGLLPVTFTSLDPTAVQLAPDDTQPGRAAVEIPEGTYSGFQKVFVDCLGLRSASISVSGPGLPSLTIPVTCVQPRIRVRIHPQSIWYYQTTEGFALPVGSGNLLVAPSEFEVQDPQSGFTTRSATLQPGLEPIEINISNTNPAAGSVSANIAHVEQPWPVFTPTASGTTELVFSSTIPVNPERISVRVLPTLFAEDTLNLASGFQSLLSPYLTLDLVDRTVTYTSLDPSKVLISASPAEPGSASITAAVENQVYLQALSPSGIVGIKLSKPGQADFVTTAVLSPPSISRSSIGGVAVLGQPGVSSSFRLRVTPGSVVYQNPNAAPVTIAVSSSNPAVIPQPAQVRSVPGEALPRLTFTPASEGRSVLHLSSTDIAIDPAEADIEIQVTQQRINLKPLNVPAGGWATGTLTLPDSTTRTVTLTSDNPSIVAVGGSAEMAGASYVISNSNLPGFIVKAVAASGIAHITASSPGLAPATAEVRIGPAGYIWSRATSTTIARYRDTFSPEQILFQLYALDAATLVPINLATIPGVALPTIRSSNPAIVTAEREPYPYTWADAHSVGEASLILEQPVGLSPPATSTVLAVKVIPSGPVKISRPVSVGKDLIATIIVRSLPGFTGPLTITSSDPSGLRVSVDPTVPGSESITINLSQGNTAFFAYVHGIAAGGTAAVSFSAEGLETATAQFDLRPTYLVLSPGDPQTAPAFGSPAKLSVALRDPSASSEPDLLRPGANPIDITLTTSRPSAGALAPTTIRISPGSYFSSAFFYPTSPGEAIISATSTAGYPALPGKTNTLAITVTPGAFQMSPAFATVSAAGGAATFTATPSTQGTPVHANGAAAWINITSVSGSTVAYNVAPNTAAVARTGHISVNSTYAFRIEQAAAVPTPIPTAGLRYIPVPPCRLADTRGTPGPFGQPALQAGQARSFPVPSSPCGIPPLAQAYALNITVVPKGPLGYLTIFPTGQAQPFVSTLNSIDGRVKANAAIVPAGTSGAVSVFATDATEMVLDIAGYFVVPEATSVESLAFFPVTPCRVFDTRNPAGSLGGPVLAAGNARSFPIRSLPCGIPSTARAYSMNATVVPQATLGYLTLWPTGQNQPFVSTLNATLGGAVANAAIVPAGANGEISAFVSDSAHLLIDINGYFAPAGSAGALRFFSLNPCRLLDSRNPAGPLGGPILAASQVRSWPLSSGACNFPSTAAAYSLNATVVPGVSGLGYLSMWPTGFAQPFVSTLNAIGDPVVANAAIVPAGASGAVATFVTDGTHLILDANGYFAP